MKTTNIFLVLFLSLLLSACSKSDLNNDEPIDLSLYTYIPDDKFEDLLIDLGYDNRMDNYVLTSNIKNIKELVAIACGMWTCSGIGISDFTGLEDFISLERLICQSNELTTLDLSKNTALKVLTCNNNDLTSLNVTKNTELEILECSGNVLTSLDVSNNIKLRYLEIGFSVFHRGNNLISIDISKNVVLYRFLCSNNNLTKLDVSNNTELEYLDSLNNIIECIQVNQYQLNSGSWNWHKDPNTIFSLDCNY